MKCEEVVEWMHRYLDHDLGEVETAQMLQHVAQCPECAENFSMLRALSRELKDLPQVSPKFSLVDAIMPQLDAIDEARREQSSTIQEMSPVPAAFENLQRSSERKTKQKWLNSMAGRMSMGAAAAAVVLGVAIWGYQPEQIENAESMIMRSGASQQDNENVDQNPLSKDINNNDSATSPRESSNDVFVGESNATLNEEGDSEATVTPEENGVAQTQETEIPAEQAPKLPATESKPAPSRGAQDSTSSSPASGTQKTHDQNENQNPEQRNQDGGSETSPTTGDDNEVTEPVDQDAESFSVQDMAPNAHEGAPAEGSMAPDPNTGTDPTEGTKGLVGPNQGIAATVAPKEWKSPDGSYVVMLIGEQISIYSTPANEPDVLNLVEQRTVEGTLKSASWSQDGTAFNYETEQQDGTTAKKTFNVKSTSSGTSAK